MLRRVARAMTPGTNLHCVYSILRKYRDRRRLCQTDIVALATIDTPLRSNRVIRLSQPTVCSLLNQLEHARLIDSEKVGQKVFYWVEDNHANYRIAVKYLIDRELPYSKLTVI